MSAKYKGIDGSHGRSAANDLRLRPPYKWRGVAEKKDLKDGDH